MGGNASTRPARGERRRRAAAAGKKTWRRSSTHRCPGSSLLGQTDTMPRPRGRAAPGTAPLAGDALEQAATTMDAILQNRDAMERTAALAGPAALAHWRRYFAAAAAGAACRRFPAPPHGAHRAPALAAATRNLLRRRTRTAPPWASPSRCCSWALAALQVPPTPPPRCKTASLPALKAVWLMQNCRADPQGDWSEGSKPPSPCP